MAHLKADEEEKAKDHKSGSQQDQSKFPEVATWRRKAQAAEGPVISQPVKCPIICVCLRNE